MSGPGPERAHLRVLALAATATSRWQHDTAPTCHHSPSPADPDPGEKGVILLGWRNAMATCPLCTHVRFASRSVLSRCAGCGDEPVEGRVHLVELTDFLDPGLRTGPAGRAARLAVVLCPTCSPGSQAQV